MAFFRATNVRILSKTNFLSKNFSTDMRLKVRCHVRYVKAITIETLSTPLGGVHFATQMTANYKKRFSLQLGLLVVWCCV